MPSNLALNCWFLTGPTAAGKSAVGVELARRIDAEIVSLDSMTLYRGLDIGTAKPTPRRAPQRAAPPDRRPRTARRVQPGPIRRGGGPVRGRDRRPRTRGAVRGRHAAVSERAAARHLRGTAGRLGAAPPVGRPGPAAAAASGCTNRWPRSIRPRPPDCTPTTRAGSSARWRFTRRRAGRSASGSGSSTWAGRRPIAACSCSIGPRRNSTPGSSVAWPRCSPPDWWRRFAADFWRRTSMSA